MARGRKCGSMTGLKRAASNARRKATIGRIGLAYMALWGKTPPKNNRGRG